MISSRIGRSKRVRRSFTEACPPRRPGNPVAAVPENCKIKFGLWRPNTSTFTVGDQVGCTMEKEVRRHKKIHLALAIAEGESIIAWAQENGVPERTAFRWAQDPKVRREVEACRRRTLNEAIGRMTRISTNAVDGIVTLAREAESESVQLRAWRAVPGRPDGRRQVLGPGGPHGGDRGAAQCANWLHESGAPKQSAPGDGPCPRAGNSNPYLLGVVSREPPRGITSSDPRLRRSGGTAA
jgi:hypothetical protein